jgi:Tol biopolymer transport system component
MEPKVTWFHPLGRGAAQLRPQRPPNERTLLALAASAALISFTIVIPAVGAYPRPGETTRASESAGGAEAKGDSFTPAIGANGRHVAFVSSAPNLVRGDLNSRPDVFLRDMRTGAIQLISRSRNGESANRDSFEPIITPDGRYVAFASTATDLIAGEKDPRQSVFLLDRKTNKVTKVSRETEIPHPIYPTLCTRTTPGSGHPAISTTGRYVVYARNHVALLDECGEIFLFDTKTKKTELVSRSFTGDRANGLAWNPAISGNGRYVTYESSSTDAVFGDMNATYDIFVYDTKTEETKLASVTSDGQQTNWSGSSLEPDIDASGRHVVFVSNAINLVPADTNRARDIFIHDTKTGRTERVSVSSQGVEADGASAHPVISDDGRYVVFESTASNLVPGDENAASDVFVHDIKTKTTERISVSTRGDPDGASGKPAIGPDGRYVAFESLAANLVAGDANDASDVFVRDRGPSQGFGALRVARSGKDLTGWATFAGAELVSAEANVSRSHPGPYIVWARVCLKGACATISRKVQL